jgi:glycosyltransferase involved in cell wall biosynthesis
MQKITHCVLMVSYNHEKWIRTALDSIFENELLPDKIYLFDDCSKDKTWEIVKDYVKKYPTIFFPKRNKHNLGIFGNINQAWDTGRNCGCDIISWCSGDDYLKKGLFSELNNVVQRENIRVGKEKFIIITNTEELSSDGNIKIIDNYKLKRQPEKITEARLLGQISYREIGLSRLLMKDIEPYRLDVGLYADGIVCMDYETQCEKIYFTDFVSAGYRCGVGTVSKEKRTQLLESKIKVWNIFLNRYNLNGAEKNIVKLNILNSELFLNYSFRKVFEYLLFLLLNIRRHKYFDRSYISCIISPNLKNKIKKNSEERKWIRSF